MKIFIDTNVIISAILNPNGTPCAAYLKATTNGNQGVICEQNVDELRRIFQKKFPHKLSALEKFLHNTKLEIVPVPEATIVSEKIYATLPTARFYVPRYSPRLKFCLQATKIF